MSKYSIWIAEHSRINAWNADNIFTGNYRVGDTIDLPQTFVVIKGQGHNVLIDTGIDPDNDQAARDICEAFQASPASSIAPLLAKVGLKPEDIDTVIITHAHWDHLGSLPCLPKAHFYIQEKEVFTWLKYLALPERYALLPGLGVAIPEHFVALIRAMGEHRVTLLDGDRDNIVPGIHVRAAFDTHTAGSQYVLIETETGGKKKTYVYTGDIGYNKENLLGADNNGTFIINAFASGLPYRILQAMDAIMEHVGKDHELLLVGHDEKLWQERPSKKGGDGLYLAEICLAPGDKSWV